MFVYSVQVRGNASGTQFTNGKAWFDCVAGEVHVIGKNALEVTEQLKGVDVLSMQRIGRGFRVEHVERPKAKKKSVKRTKK